ncbi:fimbrial protein [Pseudomonas sp. CAN2814]|uniref:fimbrial protein n=1 Tax=Pseudomonas sp. CAN1 TaxID=3046726 RepID=UPI002648E89F|nr:fimbrial protein [Pseudomonas sp. CAN1]MDN6859914.1 fimbrial protein [Pseudomonas sp. CAN1]
MAKKAKLTLAGLALSCLLALFATPEEASAATTCTFSPAAPAYVTLNLPSSITVPAGAKVGAVLWSGSTGNTQSLATNCNGTWYAVIAYVSGVSMAQTAAADVYATNVPGIGVKVTGYGTSMPTPGTARNMVTYGAGTIGSYLSFGLSLVLTGPVGSGGTVKLASPLAGGYSSNSPTTLLQATAYGLLNITGSTKINLPGCTTSNVDVPMGRIPLNRFSAGVGSTSPSVPFQLELNCPANWNGINYRIDPATPVVSGTNAVVALDASSTASGIGLQLLDNVDSPLSADKGFQKAVPLGSAPGSDAYNKAAAGIYQIPLRARYYRTGATVGAGKANSSMTFTITYQ